LALNTELSLLPAGGTRVAGTVLGPPRKRSAALAAVAGAGLSSANETPAEIPTSASAAAPTAAEIRTVLVFKLPPQ
jgi:hypothetical protein